MWPSKTLAIQAMQELRTSQLPQTFHVLDSCKTTKSTLWQRTYPVDLICAKQH